MVSVDPILKKRMLEITKEDSDASMVMKSLKIKFGFTLKRESWGDKSLDFEAACAQKPVGSDVGGVLKKRRLDRTDEQDKRSFETPLKAAQFHADARRVLSHCAKEPLASVGGVLKKRRLERTQEEKVSTETPLKTTEFHADAKWVLSNCADKPMGSFDGVLKKTRLERSQEEGKGNIVNPLKTTEFHDDAKRVLSDWKKIKRERKREAARRELAQIKNTAGFGDDMEAMIEFEKICGYSMSYPTDKRDSCYGFFCI